MALIRGVEAPLIKRLDRWKALHLPAVLGPLPHILHLPETALENLGGTPAQTSSTQSPSTATPATSTCRARLGKTPIGLTLLTAGGRRDVDVAEDEVLGPALDGYALVLNVGVGFYHRRSGDIVEGDIFTN